MRGVIWSIKDIVNILIKRQENEFDGNMAVSGDRGNGKTLVKGSKVLMSGGSWKNVEDIKIGDEVISPRKDKTFSYEKIKEIHSRFEKDIYDIKEVTRNKRILYSCAANHELPVIKRYSKRTSKDDSTPREFSRKIKNLSAEELSKKYCSHSHYSSFTTPLVEFRNCEDFDINPYCLGVFLGDGSFIKNLSITTDDPEIMEELSKVYPIMNIHKKKNTTAKQIRFSVVGEFSEKLVSLGLRGKKSYDKIIPKGFLNTSKEFRLNLLAGLIDTDGFISKGNQITICTKSLKLAENMKELVFSLGGYSLIRKVYKKSQDWKENKLYYDISVQFKDPRILPLRLERKKERLRKRKIDPTHIAIESVKREKGEMVYGFSITGESKWHITDDWMVTHNSTLIGKTFYRFKKFRPWKHQVYTREDVIDLLKFQTLGLCWDDEAINSGYKRNFMQSGQIELIKILTNYRDNLNIFASAIPNFFSLDKDLRDLYFFHLHVIERGIAVVHMPLQGRLYSQDRWDAKFNAKVEERWSKRMLKDPNFKPPYHRLTTFRGYLFFQDLTAKQKILYKEIKKLKRSARFEQEGEKKSFLERLYEQLIAGKLTRDGLIQICWTEGKKWSNVSSALNTMLTDNGETKTLSEVLVKKEKPIHNKSMDEINNLVPSF